MIHQEEVSTALKFLESRGHHVGIVHLPPPRFGTEMRVWVDNISCSFDEVSFMAREEGMSLTA